MTDHQPAPEAVELPDAFWEAMQRLIENAAAQGSASMDDARLVGRYRDRLAALARQAPAVPAGMWLAPMEPDFQMKAAGIRAGSDMWHEWFAMRDSWLSRHPQPQAVTEDARDGALRMARAHIVWESFGECRSPGWYGAPPRAAETVKIIDAAMSKEQP